MADFVRIGVTTNYIGLSTDTKPTVVAPGSTCRESDTDIEFVTLEGTNWVARDSLVRLVAGSAIAGKVGIDQVTADANKVVLAPSVASSANVHAPAVATAAVITKTAVAAVKHVIGRVVWSYTGGLPVGGNLKIEDVSGTTVFSIDICDEGPGEFDFGGGIKSAAVNTAMIVTLASGGAGITGKVNIPVYRTEA